MGDHFRYYGRGPEQAFHILMRQYGNFPYNTFSRVNIGLERLTDMMKNEAKYVWPRPIQGWLNKTRKGKVQIHSGALNIETSSTNTNYVL